MAQRDDIADLYPLSPLQRGLLFHALYAPDSAQYFEQLTCAIDGALDPARFAAAWQAIVDRHPILRSAFVSQTGREPVQVVMKRVELAVRTHDWRGSPAGEQARRFEALLAADQAEGFALHRAPLVRVILVRTGDQAHRLVFSHHHLLLDGWSLPLVLRELFAVYYADRHADQPLALPDVRPYGDYIAWLGRQDRAAADAFWRATLGELTSATPLAIDLRAAEPAERVITTTLRLDAQQTSALRALARDAAVTLNTVIQAAWALVLGRHGRTDDVVFGVTMAGRPAELAGADAMVGLFINTLPLRLAITADQPIRAWLPAIQRAQSDLQRFAYTSLGDAHGASGVPRDQPLFHALYAFENFPLGDALDTLTGALRVRDARLAEKTHYPLTLVVVPFAEIDLKLGYDCDRIPDHIASGMLGQLAHVLAAMAADPAQPARAIGLIPSPAAVATVRFAGAGPAASAPSLAAAFQRAAAQFADRIAIRDGAHEVSYRALDHRADSIAQALRARGAGPEVRIGICVERSSALIAAMLGVIKAGAAYVPIDPRYPAERARWMAEDSGCLLVLASPATAALLADAPCPVVDLSAIADDATPSIPADARAHAAYVIYTSGSTGTPKGCVITQDNLLRLFSSTHWQFQFDHNDVWTFFHSFAFDFSVWELWGALLHGGRIVVVSYDQSRDPDGFYALLARERVTVLNQTPSAFAQLMAAEARCPAPLALRTVIFGGEALDLAALAPWFARHGDRTPRLVNMYGITETTVHVTYRPITADDTRTTASLIGQPIADLAIHLLDDHGHPVPDGVPGELCVGGAGVSRGYLDRPALTAQRFVRDPFSLDPAARLYRSGDLARRRPDGDLEYLGRIDHQVKLRGFRIELAEIEHALTGHPAVAGALAIVVDGRLAAYVVPRAGAALPTAGELGVHLRRGLPDHMIPELFVALDAFPLTLQGKLDRRALPDPRQARLAAARDHAAPETADEVALCRIWRDVLEVAEVGLDDDYFALGGDSIRAIRVVALAGKAGLAIRLRDLFAHPTPRQLIAAAQAAPAAPAAPAALPQAAFALIGDEDRAALPAEIVDAYPIARLQAGMLFHGDAPAADAARLYHDVFAFRLALAFDAAAWRASVEAVIDAHPVLRTSFHFAGFSGPLQLVHATLAPPLTLLDLRELAPDARDARTAAWFEAERTAGYDVQRPGLWRLAIARLTDEHCELIIAVHHAILDGWSLATLLAELSEHYLHRLGRRAAPLAAPAGNAFRDFVALEQRAEADPASRAYWDGVLEAAPVSRIARWPGERDRTAVEARRTLPRAISEAVRAHAAAARLPVRSLLLAVHARAIALLTGERDVVTGVVGNGRPETVDGARGLGLFLNTLPLRLAVDRAPWIELARAVHDADRAMLAHQRFPMAALRRRHGGELFATSFNYVHFRVFEAVLGSGDVALLASRGEERIDIPFSVTWSTDAVTGELHLAIAADPQAITPAQAEAAAALYEACAAALARDPAAMGDPDGVAMSTLVGPARAEQLAPVHAAVARRTLEAPDAVAVSLEDRSLSRAALDRAANALAARLVEHGLTAGQPVVLCFERSFALVTAMLAVMRAGGAYAPVAADGPPARIAEVLARLDQPLVLAGRTEAARLPADARVWIVDEPGEGGAMIVAPTVEIAADQPAYVLFTSGSTGAQRGVVVSHGALAHHMAWFLDRFPLTADDAILQKTPASFDASVWEFWAALMSGARLRLARPDGHRDPAYLAGVLAAGEASVLQLVPSLLDRLLDEPGCAPGALRLLFAGGEALRVASVARATDVLGVPVINLYGPTEATIQCAFAEIRALDASSSEMASIGRPIDGVTITVRDPALRVVPVGAPGELCVAGPTLALGYWNDPGATGERFVADPAAPAHRLLRTGDRARVLADGTLQFLGRLDDQLKLRGVRVEPGEVEARLAALPGVAQAVVAARPGPTGAARLIAWVEPAGADDDLAEIRAALAGQLPDAMLPSAWQIVRDWPRLTSGKIDRRALPDPASPPTTAAHLAPAPGAEASLAAIWRRVLAVDAVGAGDDFFALGGDSILAMQMVAQARGADLALSVRDVLAHPVLRDLAARARPAVAVEAPADNIGDIPLTPAQRWFVDLELPAPDHWNHAVLLALPAGLTADLVERAFHAVVERRDAFTLRLTRDAAGWHQQRGALPPAFEAIDLGALAGDARHLAQPTQAAALRAHAAIAQTRLSLAHGPICRAVHYDLGAGASRLLVICHHTIVDGLSWRLLLADLGAALAGAPLPPAGQLARCAHQLAAIAASSTLDAELPIWQHQLAGLAPLPLDTPGGANREADARSIQRTIPAALTRRLLDDAPGQLRASPQELLLAGFVHAIAAWHGGPRLGFILEGHGRARLADLPDASDAVGWLTAMYPVAVDFPEAPGPLACLHAVKAALRAIPGDGSGYGLLRHLRRAPALAGRAEPAIGFNYLGRIDGSFAGAPFTVAGEDTGPAVDPAAPRPRAIDLVLHVEAGELRASWQYSPGLHARATIEALDERFAAGLAALVALEPRAALCPADFPLAALDDRELLAALPDDPIDDLLPLAPVQDGMVFHALHDPARGVYVQQVVAELTGAASIARLEMAWRAVAAAHPMLRASFVTVGSRTVQRLHHTVDVPIETLDLAQDDLTAWLDADRRRGFAIDRPPLMRVTLIRGAAQRLVWTHHHLLLDGWSLPIVFRDFLAAYHGATLTRGDAGDYAEVLRWIARRDRDADAAFWRDALRDFPGPTAPRGEPTTEDVISAEARATIPAAALDHAARAWRVSQATLLQAAWAFVLGRHAGTDDVLLGVTVSGRPDEVPAAARVVGTLINTLPLRVPLAASQPLADWLADLRTTQAGVIDHQASALVDVARWAGITGGAPLFEAIIVHENYPLAAAPGDAFAVRVTARESNHYPLALYALPGDTNLELSLYYQAPRFTAALADALLAQVAHVVAQLARAAGDPTARLGDLQLADRTATIGLTTFNATARPVEAAWPAHARVRAQVAATPDAIAVITDGTTLTYRALATRVTALTARLAAAGVAPGAPVGLCMARSADMIVALLAVLEAGAFYVPLDPAFPDARLAAMLADTAPAVVISDDALAPRLRTLAPRVITADAPDITAPHTITTRPDALAYAIFTSGSTGRPKAVLIPHRALANLLDSFAHTPGLAAGDRWLAVTTLAFDIATLELLLPLVTGASVIIAGADTTGDAERLAQLIARSRPTVMQATPATWRMLLAHGWQPPHGLRILCGGEALDDALADALLAHGAELWNVYGPTETTIWSTIHRCVAGDRPTSIGQPIANTTCHVVDRAGHPLPPGVPGELVIGGAGLAHGYLGRAALTAERFIPDHLTGTAGARLYRTGDLARRHTDGRLEHLGRLDHQVKLRGFRVELAEIEHALAQLPGVAQAVVVIAAHDGDPRLVAHLIATPALDPTQLRTQLATTLPGYMIPSSFRTLEAYPLTTSRKIDRAALAAWRDEPSRAPRTPPRTPLEHALVEIWRDILGAPERAAEIGPEIGIDDGFFELGGHSLTAVRVHARVREVFRVELALADLLREPTIAGLAARITAADPEPGRIARIATAYLRLRNMSDEEKARLRARRRGDA